MVARSGIAEVDENEDIREVVDEMEEEEGGLPPAPGGFGGDAGIG